MDWERDGGREMGGVAVRGVVVVGLCSHLIPCFFLDFRPHHPRLS